MADHEEENPDFGEFNFEPADNLEPGDLGGEELTPLEPLAELPLESLGEPLAEADFAAAEPGGPGEPAEMAGEGLGEGTAEPFLEAAAAEPRWKRLLPTGAGEFPEAGEFAEAAAAEPEEATAEPEEAAAEDAEEDKAPRKRRTSSGPGMGRLDPGWGRALFPGRSREESACHPGRRVCGADGGDSRDAPANPQGFAKPKAAPLPDVLGPDLGRLVDRHLLSRSGNHGLPMGHTSQEGQTGEPGAKR